LYITTSKVNGDAPSVMHDQQDNIAREDNNYMSEEDFQANRHTKMLDGEKMSRFGVPLWFDRKNESESWVVGGCSKCS
jgi:hypothetical protein